MYVVVAESSHDVPPIVIWEDSVAGVDETGELVITSMDGIVEDTYQEGTWLTVTIESGDYEPN